MKDHVVDYGVEIRVGVKGSARHAGDVAAERHARANNVRRRGNDMRKDPHRESSCGAHVAQHVVDS